MLAVSDDRVAFQGAFQTLFALDEREGAKVLAGEVRRVENVIDDLRVIARVEGVLQLLEAAATILGGHHDLAVEPSAVEAELFQLRGQARQLGGPVVSRAREELRRALRQLGEQA